MTKDIGNYIVYADGRVWSKRSKDWIKSKVFKGRYVRVKIDNKKIPLHRLIAKSFLDNPLNHPEIDHINNDKEDNRVENLQWISSFDNRSKAHKDKLIPYCYGDKNGRSKKNRSKLSSSEPILNLPGKSYSPPHTINIHRKCLDAQ